MKKLSKIILAKTYDVLSENEMKKVVGGMGSGIGSGTAYVDCESILSASACNGTCLVNGYVGTCNPHTEGTLVYGCYCDNTSI